jgi:hypothetical protein
MAKDKDKEQELQEGPNPQEMGVFPDPAEPPPEHQGKNKPGRQRSTDDSFTGRAAQLAVMAELLQLRCNAAIPEVDLGTDVFAFKDDREEVVRIQVKSCTVPHKYADGSGYSAKFALPMKQLSHPDDRPPLYYALAVLRDGQWVDFLVVSRASLWSYYNGEERFGSRNKTNDDLEITVEFRDKVECSGQDLTDCRNAWKSLPPLRPPVDLKLVAQEAAGASGPADPGIPPPAGTGQA